VQSAERAYQQQHLNHWQLQLVQAANRPQRAGHLEAILAAAAAAAVLAELPLLLLAKQGGALQVS
jgi:hypothetical protein